MKIQGNGVFERDGKFFMDTGQVVGWSRAPKSVVGPFDSLVVADAAARYVFVRWVETGKIPSRDECVQAVNAH